VRFQDGRMKDEKEKKAQAKIEWNGRDRTNLDLQSMRVKLFLFHLPS